MCPSASTTGWTLVTNLGNATSEGMGFWSKVAIREERTGKEREGEGGRGRETEWRKDKENKSNRAR